MGTEIEAIEVVDTKPAAVRASAVMKCSSGFETAGCSSTGKNNVPWRLVSATGQSTGDAAEYFVMRAHYRVRALTVIKGEHLHALLHEGKKVLRKVFECLLIWPWS